MGFKRGQLRNFVAVAEAGQVTTAARGLGLPQPLLSQSIRQLEHELGVELLEREPRGVKLTPAGEAFIPKARASLAAHADALSTAEALRRAASDTIDIGFLGAPPVGHCAGLIEAFTDSYPEVDVRFRELPLPSAPMDSWIEGVDVALCHPPGRRPGVDLQTVRQESRLLIVQPGHRLAGSTGVSVDEILDEVFLGYHQDVDPTWAAWWSLDDHRGEPPARVGADEVRTSIEMIAAISGGAAVTAVPACHAAAIVGVVPSLSAVPILDAEPVDFALVWSPDDDRPLVESLAGIAARLASPAAETAAQSRGA